MAEEFAFTHKNVYMSKSKPFSRDKRGKDIKPQSQVKSTPTFKSETMVLLS